MAKVLNADVDGMSRRLVRIYEELENAQSANVLDMHPADMTRVVSYLDDLNGHVDWVQAQPILDFPETTPTEYDVGDIPPVKRVENEAVMDALNIVRLAWRELVNSQSIRYGCRLITHDETRLRSYLAKLTALLAYISEHQPLDMPESSPRAEVTGTGRTGLSPGVK